MHSWLFTTVVVQDYFDIVHRPYSEHGIWQPDLFLSLIHEMIL